MSVIIKVKGIPPVQAATEKALQEIADNLDFESIKLLAKLSNNKKAIGYLKNPPTAVKIALGL